MEELDKIKEIIKERSAQYGDITTEAKEIIASFNALTGHNLKDQEYFVMLVLMKLHRNQVTPKKDNLRDAIGYLDGGLKLINIYDHQ